MRFHDQRHVQTEYLALLESVSKGIGDTSEMTVDYLVAEVFNQNEIDIWKTLIEYLSSELQRESPLADQIAATTPFVGKTLVRSGVWFDGRFLQMYIDPIAQTIVHISQGECPDPTAKTDTV